MQSYMHILDLHAGSLCLQLLYGYTIRQRVGGGTLSAGCRGEVSGGPEGLVAVATTF